MMLTALPIPDITNLPLYLNILFFGILGIGMLVGFLRGFKKSLYAFIVTVIFYIVFFLTIDLVVNYLWSLELTFLGGLLANLDPAFASVTSLSEAIPLALSIYVPDIPASVLENPNLLEFIAGLGIFIVKIVYTIIYFTVIQIIYRLLTFIIRVIFLNTPKAERKYRSKNRGFGAIFGFLSGALSLFITLIVFGGLISITESVMTIASEIPETEDVVLEFPRQGIYQANYSVIPLQQAENPLEQVQEIVALAKEIVDSYNQNILVGFAKEITIHESETESVALNIYLFDMVLSFTYKEEKIAIRDELSVYAGVASNILGSEYMETRDLSDISGDLIQTSMNQLADSHLFTSILPLAIDVGSEMLEVDIPIDKEAIYAIDWKTEVMQIGEVAALVFDFINTAGLLEEDPDLETIVFDGDSVRDIFDALGESQLVTLAAYVALEPVLQSLAEDNPIKAIITVPEGMNWKDEFIAIGEIIGAVLDTEITYGQIQSGDPMTIIQALAQLDFTVILDSKIITHALINVFEGAGGFLDGEELSFLVIPEDIIWLDELDDEGNIIQNGELRNIFLAINQIAELAVSLDFNNLTAAAITELSDEAIEALFESKILVASITETVKTLDFGELALLIPDDVYDDKGYLKKTELVALVSALKTIVTALPCDEGDEECAPIGFDYTKVLSLGSATIDEVFRSLIIEVTIGNMVYEMGADVLVIPETTTAVKTVLVEGASHKIVTAGEIKKVFIAASVFEFENIEEIEFDESVILDIASDEEKIDKILDSEIIAATAGSMLFEMGEDVLTIPSVAMETISVGEADKTIVTASEIRKLLLAVSTLEITTLEGMEIGPNILKNLATAEDDTVLDENKADQIFNSTILHATISSVLIDLVSGETQVLSIPYFDEEGNTIRYRNDVDDFEYISVDEMKAIVRAILVLDIADFESIDIDTLDLDTIIDNSNIILQSAILQATISNQIINMDTDMIVVPDESLSGEDVKITTGVGEQATTFVAKAELIKALEAIQVLNIDLENPVFDATIINNLASDDNPDVLDDDKLNTLLDSTIIHASMSKMIIDLTTGDGGAEAVIIVPYFDESGIAVRIEDDLGNEYLSKSELISLFKAYYSLDITDFNAVDSLDINTILDNFDTLILSATLHATVSDQVINMESEAIVVPRIDHLDQPVIIVVGTEEKQTTYIASNELRATFDALEVMNIDFENPVFDATLIDNLAEDDDPETLDETKLDTLFDSIIIHASISKMLFDLTEGEEAVLSVPYYDADQDEVRFKDVDGVEYVSEQELRNALAALNKLDISDFNNVETLSLTDIKTNFDVLIASAILHATVSDQVINMESEAIVVPQIDHLDQPVIIVVGTEEKQTIYIASNELKATFDALEVMNIDFENPVFDATLIDNLAEDDDPETLDEAKLDTLFDSIIIHASISKMLFDLTEGEEAVLSVPYYDADLDVVRFKDVHGVEYVSEQELRNALAALNKLNISDFNNVETLTLNDINTNFDVLIASAILHATISDQLLTLESDDVSIPYYDYDGVSIRITVGSLEKKTVYIGKNELESTFIALELLGVDGLNQVDINIDLTDFYDPENRNKLMASAIVHSAISKQLVEVDALSVPYYDIDANAVRITRGSADLETDTEYVSDIEIHALFEVLELLEIQDLDNVQIDLDLSKYYEPEPREILLASASVHAEITKQVLDIDDATLDMPFYNESGSSIRITRGDGPEKTEYLVAAEVHALFEVLEFLGITDLNNVNMDMDLTDLYIVENRNILLASAAVHLKVSTQMLELSTGDNPVIVVPDKDINGQPISVLRTNHDDLIDDVFLKEQEIHYFFEGLEILDLPIDNIDEFDGSFDLSVLYDQDNRVELLKSATMHATISDQLIDLDTQDLVIVPKSDYLDTVSIRVLRGVVEFIDKDEIHHFFDAIEILGLSLDDISDFNGDISLDNFFASKEPADYETNQTTLLASAIMHATVSEQILGLGSTKLIVPERDVADTVITAAVNGTDYVVKNEIKALINSLDILGITDITAFAGAINLTNFYSDSNQDTLLLSASMHATISDQILDLGSDKLIVPAKDVAEENIRVTNSVDIEFVQKAEIKALIEALEVLEVTDITTFAGAINLTNFYSDSNQDTLLLSASMHATISDQILDLGSDKLIVPAKDFAEENIRVTNSVDIEFVQKAEIKALIEALEVLEVTDITSFTGAVTLSHFFESANPATYSDNQDILLASAAMHATISDQLLDLGASALIVPDTDVSNNSIRKNVGAVVFIYKTEIKAIIDSLDILGLNSIDSMTGAFSLAKLDTPAKQNKLLASASMHATISDKIFAVDDNILYVPDKRQDDLTAVKVKAGLPDNLLDFVTKDEIKALIDALIIMGYTDLSSFTAEFELGEVFANPETVLLSASIQAMFSDRIINDTGGALQIPDKYYGTINLIRIALTDVTYIEYDELVALITALNALELDDFSSFSFTPAVIFELDSFDTILASEIIQATISSNLLAPPTLDETAPAGSGKLIVPSFFRQDITVETLASKQIEKTELDSLLTSLKLLGINNFSDGMSGTSITTIFMNETSRNTFLASGSIHVTTDNLLKGNTNIGGSIPALAKEDAYNIIGITTKAEIINFIVAVNTIGATDFTEANFTVASIAALDPADQDAILTSMIVRNKITPDLETLCSNPFNPYPLTDDDYMSGATHDFLKKQSILNIIDHYY